MQLKAFVQWASFDPRMEDNYYARSQDDKINNGDDTITEETAIFIIAFFVTGFSATFAIITMLLIMYYYTKRWDKKLNSLATSKNRDRHAQSQIFAVSLTLILINIYATALDIMAIVTTIPCKEESDIHEARILCVLSYIVLSVDALGLITWIVCSLVSAVGSCMDTKGCCNQKQYLLLALSMLGPTATVVIHLPYIFIAYLNDAEHATSVFIYYIVVVFVIFGSLNFTYITCQRAIIAIERKSGNEINEYVINDTNTFGIFRTDRMRQKDEQCNERCVIATFVVVFLLFIPFILFLIGMITTAFAITQITRSFDDTSNRLLGFYQTVIVLIGAYLLYNKY